MDIEYQKVLSKRYAEYQKHMDSMEPAPIALREWASVMAIRHGDTVRVHFAVYDNWLMALLVVRYGEAVNTVDNWTDGGSQYEKRFWPVQFSEADIKRAIEWKKNPAKKPPSVTYEVDYGKRNGGSVTLASGGPLT